MKNYSSCHTGIKYCSKNFECLFFERGEKRTLIIRCASLDIARILHYAFIG